MLQALNPNRQSQQRSLTDDWRMLYISSLTLMQHCNRSTYCTKSFSCLAEVEKFGWTWRVNQTNKSWGTGIICLWRFSFGETKTKTSDLRGHFYPALIYKETEMSHFHNFFYDIRLPLDDYLGCNIVKMSIESFFFNAVKWFFFVLSLFIRDWGSGEILNRRWKGNQN